MQIVIDIHEKDYQSILNSGQVPYGVVYAIMNGTPLPKGHGRLIDADKLHQDIFDDDCWQFSGGISPNEGYSWKQVQNAPTIVEADKEG